MPEPDLIPEAPIVPRDVVDIVVDVAEFQIGTGVAVVGIKIACLGNRWAEQKHRADRACND